MAEYLTQNLVNLSDRGSSPNKTAELALHHGESCFYVRPFVIMLQEGFPIEVAEMPGAIPQTIGFMMMVTDASGIDLEGGKRCATECANYPKTPSIGVTLLSGDLTNRECLGCLAYQLRELQIISRLIGPGLDAGDYVGFHATNQVSLNLSLLAALRAIFVVKPSGIRGGGESRGINGSQWAGTLFVKTGTRL